MKKLIIFKNMAQQVKYELNFAANYTHVAHNSWANIGKLRSDCWPTVGDVRYANRVPTNHLPTMASSWASANSSFVHQPTIPNNGPT